MEKRYSISLYLDTRRKKRNGLFPVKLRVYSSLYEKTKLYPTAFELTESDFRSAWTSLKPKTAFHNQRLRLQALENKANEAAEKIIPFNFDKFEKSLFRESASKADAIYFYQQAIDSLKANGQIGTASNYQLAMKSLIDFIVSTTGKRPTRLPLHSIDIKWLMRYEKHMIGGKGRSQTTVSIYLRTLRTIFNQAMGEGELAPELYPFGAKKYIIPAVKKVKKALDMNKLQALFDTKTETPNQDIAKDYFFFAYSLGGVNVKDIACLTWGDIHETPNGAVISFIRGKTETTKRTNNEPILLPCTPLTIDILKKRAGSKKSQKDLVFDIISNDLSPQQKRNKIKAFTRFLNEHLKQLAENAGITDQISTNWSRHSSLTNVIRYGATPDQTRDISGHSTLKVTNNYVDSADIEELRKLLTEITSF